MFLGALLDLGLDLAVLETELARLNLSGYRVLRQQVQKGSIRAIAFKVLLTAGPGEHLADSEYVEASPADDPGGHAVPLPDHHHSTARSLPEILDLIQTSELSPTVKQRASRIFTRLAEAEGRVHGQPPEQVHFHEVGGVDAVIDIVGACIGLEILGIEQVYASPLHLGGGFVRSAHGLLPIPAPATVELLTGVPVYTTQASGELVTPTGAALVSTLACSFGPMPQMILEKIGCGAGSRDREFPNVLRVLLGESQSDAGHRPSASRPAQVGSAGGANRDPFPEQHAAPIGAAGWHEGPAVVIEANLDDMSPQLYEYLLEQLLTAGALDVLLIPAQMKKSRPAMLLQVLAHPDSVEELLTVIFRESTTIGARSYPVVKHMLQREIRVVHTQYGDINVKIARLGAEVVNISPEYEDCKRLAIQLGQPLKEILTAALAAAHG